MTACGGCGFDAGFATPVCPRCGAGSSAPPARRAIDAGARTVFQDDATRGPSGPSSAAHGCFLVVGGPDVGKQFLVLRTGIAGRNADSGVSLTDPRVSSRHALIHVDSGRVTYSDLETTNGSFLNMGLTRRRLRGPHVLSDGDEIALGNTVLRYLKFKKEGSR
jgi:hypothetical protein